jgi:sulfatase maturation enzyme AslB (radical SAM superfamily)
MKVIEIKSASVNLFPTQNLKDKFCLSPFVQVNIDSAGNVGICGCSSWQPTSVGNIFSHNLDELLSGSIAQNIRKSIIDGSYIYCHPDRCGILRTNSLLGKDELPPDVKWAIEDVSRFLTPKHIVLSMDATCNLSCPSCRHTVIKLNDEDKERQQQLSKIITSHLFSTPTNNPIELTLDASGDVFASSFLLDFLSGISSQNFPNLKIDILSNGLLAEQRWHRLGEMQRHVKKITISYDAANPETYEKLRRGGKWPDIMRAMAWLQNKKKENGMEFHARMVVQKDNYNQMLDFYNLSKSFDCNTVQFQRLMNWGTYTPEELADNDVCDPLSSLYPDVLMCIKQVADFPDTEFWHGMPKLS